MKVGRMQVRGWAWEQRGLAITLRPESIYTPLSGAGGRSLAKGKGRDRRGDLCWIYSKTSIKSLTNPGLQLCCEIWKLKEKFPKCLVAWNSKFLPGRSKGSSSCPTPLSMAAKVVNRGPFHSGAWSWRPDEICMTLDPQRVTTSPPRWAGLELQRPQLLPASLCSDSSRLLPTVSRGEHRATGTAVGEQRRWKQPFVAS